MRSFVTEFEEFTNRNHANTLRINVPKEKVNNPFDCFMGPNREGQTFPDQF